jgi:hypothetical protein
MSDQHLYPVYEHEHVLYTTPASGLYAPGVQAPMSPPTRTDACANIVGFAALGAVIGGAAAAGAGLRLVEREALTAGEALADVGRAAATGAAASAAAGAVATAVAGQGLTRLAVLFAAGTAAMYGLQRGLERDR